MRFLTLSHVQMEHIKIYQSTDCLIGFERFLRLRRKLTKFMAMPFSFSSLTALQLKQPQPVDVPPTLPQLEQPQPVDVPLHLQPQEHGVEPLTVPPEQAVQSKQKQHLRLVLLLAPLTEPFDLQQGLQQDWQTKLGKVMPPQRQELHIRTYLQKRCHGTRIP